MTLRLYALSLLLCLLPVSGLALGDAVAPTPFTARYQLDVRGGPNASIEHRLSRNGHHWQSEMQAAIAIAHGDEHSRFTIDAGDVRPLYYSSGYSLLGLGERYRLAPDALRDLPDRQTALFSLSQRAATGACREDCRLRYQDHKGEEEVLDYRVVDRDSLKVPAGDFTAVTVEAIDPDKPDRRLVLSFHPELPGLLLAADYHRDGARKSRLVLTHLDRHAP